MAESGKEDKLGREKSQNAVKILLNTLNIKVKKINIIKRIVVMKYNRITNVKITLNRVLEK